MTYQAPPIKHLVLKAKRETVLLVVAASAMTLALSYDVHSHRLASPHDDLAQQAWAGRLADLTPQEIGASETAPMTSASLVVPNTVLALPQASVRPLVKLHGCDGSLCGSRTSGTPVPPPSRRAVVADSMTPAPPVSHPAAPHREKPSLIARLNPLNHLPDTATLKRPFSVASDTVVGWFRRF